MLRHRPVVGVGEVRADGRWFRRSDDRWPSWGTKWWWWWRRSSPAGVDHNGIRHTANGGRAENNNTDAGSSVYTVAATEGQRKSTGGHRYSANTNYSHATTGTILEMTEPPNNYHHQQQQEHHHHHHLHQQEQQKKNHNHHHHQLQLRREGNISSTGRSFGSDSDNSSDSGNGPVAANDGTRFSKFITSIKYAFGSHNNNTTNGGPRTSDDQNIEPSSSSSSSSNSSTRPLVIKFTTNRSSTVAAGEATTAELNTGDDRAIKRTTGARRNRSASSSLMNGFKIL